MTALENRPLSYIVIFCGFYPLGQGIFPLQLAMFMFSWYFILSSLSNRSMVSWFRSCVFMPFCMLNTLSASAFAIITHKQVAIVEN